MKPPVFLTGATGFLGMEVLARLLEARRPRGHRARARAPTTPPPRSASTTCSPSCGATRRRTATASAPWPATSPARGSASPTASARALAEEVGAVLHCAASISFDLPLDEARAINVEGTREVIGFAREAQGARAPRPLRARLDRVRRRAVTRARSASASSTPARSSATPTSRPSGRPSTSSATATDLAAGDRPPEHRHGRVRLRLDAGVQRPLLAAARVLARAVRRGPGAAGGATSTSSRSTTSPTRSCTCSTCPTRASFNLVAGREASFVDELVELACDRFDRPRPDGRPPGTPAPARARRRARRGLPAVLRHGRRVRRLAHPGRPAGPGATRRGCPTTSATLMDYAEETRWGKRSMTREEARERVGREPAAA